MKFKFDLYEDLLMWKSVLCMLPSICLLLQFSKVFGMVSELLISLIYLFIFLGKKMFVIVYFIETLLFTYGLYVWYVVINFYLPACRHLR